MVEILCSEMACAFAETGTPLPPWRQHAAMASKWQPRRSEEVDVTAALNNGTGLLLGPLNPGGAAANNGGGNGAPGGGARRLTGPSTVAQRLMMLGVTQQQSNPSPIAEGVEHGSGEEDGWGSVGGGPASTASSVSSLHLVSTRGGGGQGASASQQPNSTASTCICRAPELQQACASPPVLLLPPAAALLTCDLPAPLLHHATRTGTRMPTTSLRRQHPPLASGKPPARCPPPARRWRCRSAPSLCPSPPQQQRTTTRRWCRPRPAAVPF